MGKAAREARRVTQRAHEATFGVFCPGMLEVLSIGRGDLKLTLDGSSPEDMARARQLIEEMLTAGYGIYVETEEFGTVRVKQFNPERMTYTIIETPGHALPPAPEPPALGPGEAVVPDEVIPKRGPGRPRKAATREVPVAGSRSTAVGRTAGG